MHVSMITEITWRYAYSSCISFMELLSNYLSRVVHEGNHLIEMDCLEPIKWFISHISRRIIWCNLLFPSCISPLQTACHAQSKQPKLLRFLFPTCFCLNQCIFAFPPICAFLELKLNWSERKMWQKHPEHFITHYPSQFERYSHIDPIQDKKWKIGLDDW